MKKLNEIFDKPFQYKKGDTNDTESHQYHIYNHKGEQTHSVNIDHIGDAAFVYFHDQHGHMSNNNKHARDSHRVFSTVKHIIQHHIQNHPQLKRIRYAADKGDGRAGLYKKIAAKHGLKVSETDKNKGKTKLGSIQIREEFLNELFDSHYPFEHGSSSKNGLIHRYGFKAGKHEYDVHVNHKNENTAHVSFSDEQGDYHNNHQHSKDSHKVFGTVMHVIKHHLKNHPHIKNVSWSAQTDDGKHTSRAKLYARMSKGLGKYKEDDSETWLSGAKKINVKLKENESSIPINNAGSGNISGLGTGAQEPGLKKRRKLLSFSAFMKKGKTNGATS